MNNWQFQQNELDSHGTAPLKVMLLRGTILNRDF